MSEEYPPMKKQIKKLTLNRETLRSMVDQELGAAGGSQEIAPGATGVSNCLQCSQYWTQCFCQ
jgi:hypothetical protein